MKGAKSVQDGTFPASFTTEPCSCNSVDHESIADYNVITPVHLVTTAEVWLPQRTYPSKCNYDIMVGCIMRYILGCKEKLKAFQARIHRYIFCILTWQQSPEVSPLGPKPVPAGPTQVSQLQRRYRSGQALHHRPKKPVDAASLGPRPRGEGYIRSLPIMATATCGLASAVKRNIRGRRMRRRWRRSSPRTRSSHGCPWI